MNAPGIIRKISVGDIKEGITYKVGQSMMGGRLYIEQILQDLEINPRHVKFDVFVSEGSSGNVRLWKSFIDEDVAIEYDISIQPDETTE